MSMIDYARIGCYNLLDVDGVSEYDFLDPALTEVILKITKISAYFTVTATHDKKYWLIAWEVYGSPYLWWVITIYNDIVDPFESQIGKTLLCPDITGVEIEHLYSKIIEELRDRRNVFFSSSSSSSKSSSCSSSSSSSSSSALLTFLISCDSINERIYIHDGFSATLIMSFSSPGEVPKGVGVLGDNLISTGYQWEPDAAGPGVGRYGWRVYEHNGLFSGVSIDSAILSYETAVSPICSGEVTGVAGCEGNVIDCCSNTNMHKFNGISSTILVGANLGINPGDIEWDGEDTLLCDDNSTIFKYLGFSSTLLDSFSTAASQILTGVTNDGEDIIAGGAALDKIYKHSGFTSTVIDSFPTPGGNLGGLHWHSIL